MAKRTAYLLISVDVNNVKTIDEIRRMVGVLSADTVFGPWDVVAHVEVNELDDLVRIVRTIRALPAITDTISLVSMEE